MGSQRAGRHLQPGGHAVQVADRASTVRWPEPSFAAGEGPGVGQWPRTVGPCDSPRCADRVGSDRAALPGQGPGVASHTRGRSGRSPRAVCRRIPSLARSRTRRRSAAHRDPADTPSWNWGPPAVDQPAESGVQNAKPRPKPGKPRKLVGTMVGVAALALLIAAACRSDRHRPRRTGRAFR